jgi:hypothetical protein
MCDTNRIANSGMPTPDVSPREKFADSERLPVKNSQSADIASVSALAQSSFSQARPVFGAVSLQIDPALAS